MVTYQRPLLFTGSGSAGFQPVGLRLALDSRTYPADGNGQETVLEPPLRAIARLGPVEQETLSHTVAAVPNMSEEETVTKSSLLSRLKSPTTAEEMLFPA